MKLRTKKDGTYYSRLSDLKNFEGSDINIHTSLFEYGLIWREIKTGEYKGEYLFIYPIEFQENEYGELLPISFDSSSLSVENIKADFDWCDFSDVESFTGSSLENTARSISDLVTYYGTQEIFGASYGQGFKITTNQY